MIDTNTAISIGASLIKFIGSFKRGSNNRVLMQSIMNFETTLTIYLTYLAISTYYGNLVNITTFIELGACTPCCWD